MNQLLRIGSKYGNILITIQKFRIFLRKLQNMSGIAAAEKGQPRIQFCINILNNLTEPVKGNEGNLGNFGQVYSAVVDNLPPVDLISIFLKVRCAVFHKDNQINRLHIPVAEFFAFACFQSVILAHD